MTRTLRTATFSMRCPHCGLADVAAGPDHSGVIAWFTCPSCGHDWSARVRDGRPVTIIEVRVNGGRGDNGELITRSNGGNGDRTERFRSFPVTPVSPV